MSSLLIRLLRCSTEKKGANPVGFAPFSTHAQLSRASTLSGQSLSDLCGILGDLLATHGHGDRDPTDEEEAGAADEAGQLGTGAGQVAPVAGISVVAIFASAVAVFIAVAATSVGVFLDREVTGQFVIAAGDGDVVIADVSRGVGSAGAVDVDVGLALVVSLDGLVEGGDARLALGVDEEADVFTGFAALDGEGDALVFLDEVSRRDRLGETVSLASSTGADGSSVSSSVMVKS